MRKAILFTLLSFILFIRIHPEKLHTFFDISTPRMFLVDKNYVYISDRNTHSVLVYDLEHFELIKKLSRKGEGPRESTTPPSIDITGDRIFVSDQVKIIVYSKDLKFLGELRPGMWMPEIIPVQDHFVLLNRKSFGNKEYHVLSFFNEKFEKLKDITISPKAASDYLFFPIAVVRSWRDRVYVNDPEQGFFIGVFNKTGEKTYTIEKKPAKIKAAERHRQRFIEHSINALGKKLFAKHKARGRYKKPLPKYIPHIKNFWVTDDTIYVKTYEVNDKEDRYIIMDLKGEILETRYLPRAFYNKFTFSNNRFYYLADNEEEEGWELHAVEL